MIEGLTYDSEEIDEIYGILGVSLRDFADLPSDEAQDLINAKVTNTSRCLVYFRIHVHYI